MPHPAFEPVLRTSDGQRIFDEQDVPAILALAELSVLVERKWTNHISAGCLPNTAALQHAEEFGHPLRFGCCRDARPTVPAALRDTVIGPQAA